eukprot:8283450-Alexandrium_andersonii.AAC.1
MPVVMHPSLRLAPKPSPALRCTRHRRRCWEAAAGGAIRQRDPGYRAPTRLEALIQAVEADQTSSQARWQAWH